MNAHPLTLSYLKNVAARPGMFMGENYDLRALELQLYGYEAALRDAGVFGVHDPFNFSFNEHLRSNVSLSCPRGWAEALMQENGQSALAFEKFLSLVKVVTSKR